MINLEMSRWENSLVEFLIGQYLKNLKLLKEIFSYIYRK